MEAIRAEEKSMVRLNPNESLWDELTGTAQVYSSPSIHSLCPVKSYKQTQLPPIFLLCSVWEAFTGWVGGSEI
jgi:hypothetical protein